MKEKGVHLSHFNASTSSVVLVVRLCLLRLEEDQIYALQHFLCMCIIVHREMSPLMIRCTSQSFDVCDEWYISMLQVDSD